MSSCVSSVMMRSWIARARATRSGWACSDAARPAAVAKARDARFIRAAPRRRMLLCAGLALLLPAVSLAAPAGGRRVVPDRHRRCDPIGASHAAFPRSRPGCHVPMLDERAGAADEDACRLER